MRLSPQIPSFCCFLFFSMPHCFISQDSAVINVPDVEHVWICISFYVWHFLMKDAVLIFLCMHITFAFGSQKIGWRAGHIWLEMNVSFTVNLQDEWLTILGSQICFDPESLSLFSFPCCNLSFLPSLCSTCFFSLLSMITFNCHLVHAVLSLSSCSLSLQSHFSQ